MKNAVDSLADVDSVKSAFRDLKDDLSEVAREHLSVKHEALINGICPLCQKESGFRDPSFTENLTSLGKSVAGVAGQFAASGLIGKSKIIAKYAEIGEDRDFPNYICLGCHGVVMQCSGCSEIIPYADTSEGHICGINSSPQTNKIAFTQQIPVDEFIVKLEKLGALKERGLLTPDEFEAQKKRLLG